MPVDDGAVLSLAVPLGTFPWRYDATRQGRAGLLARLQHTLERQLPHLHRHTVRGDSVAADSMVRALVRYPVRTAVHFFTSDSDCDAIRARLQTYPAPGAGARPLSVTPAHTLIGRSEERHFDAWFDPTGSFPTGLSIRWTLSEHLYPVTAVVHGFSKHTMMHDYFLRIMTAGVAPCDSLVCTSRAAKAAVANALDYVSQNFNREFGSRIKYEGRTDLIPLCVDTEVLSPGSKIEARARLGLPRQTLVVLYLGHMSAGKADLMPLLSTWKLLVGDMPRRQLLLIVAGTAQPSYLAQLKQCARGLGVAGQLRFVLDADDRTKVMLLRSADIFVSPSDSVQESFGLAPVEAMACGVPQVVSDWDGYRDTVAHGQTGFLVPTRWAALDDLCGTGSLLGWEFEHLALGQSIAVDFGTARQFLRILIENEALRRQMGENSRIRAVSLYSMPAVVKQYEALWSELCEIAQTLPQRERRASYLQPSYFRVFGHFASEQLGESSVVRLTDFGRRVADERELLPVNPQLSRTGVLDPTLLRSALTHLFCTGRDSAGITVGEIVCSLAPDHKASRATRHLMWLLKYGLIETGTAGPGTHRGD
ncbi:MAG: glycosyltransferase family 4 protein [Terriglobia bacterium]